MSRQVSGRPVLVLVGVLVAAVATGCGGGSGEVSTPSAPVPAITDTTTSPPPEADAAVAVCRQATTSMVVMVREYNNFVRRLNEVHDYDRAGPLDRYARETLTTGAELIGEKLTDDVPAEVADPTRDFLTTTDRLSAFIGEQRTTGLNTIADRWTRERRALLEVCGTIVPTPPSLSIHLPENPETGEYDDSEVVDPSPGEVYE